MDTTIPLIALGVLILLGSMLKRVFVLKKIPDILTLILIGIIAGPVLNIITPQDFGIIGPIFAIATLVIILFESGSSIEIGDLIDSLKTGVLLSLLSFVFTVAIAAGVFTYFFHVDSVTAILFGCIVGGTSSAIVIPLIKHLTVSPLTQSTLMLESVLTDVFCIITTLNIMTMVKTSVFDPQTAFFSMGSVFFIAIGTGITSGFFWALLKDKIQNIKNIFTIPAVVCIVYGITELMSGSGAIAVLIFGVVVANAHFLISNQNESLKEIKFSRLTRYESEFFAQLVDLLKIFFFIYVGISLKSSSTFMILVCIFLVALIHLFRYPIIIATIHSHISRQERWIAVAMIPKGLAAAVLAGLPLQQGFVHGELIESMTYTVVIVSIISTSLLSFIIEYKINKNKPEGVVDISILDNDVQDAKPAAAT
jgi:NhaP-type Na+/H+ or K+/H+ antiporter